MDSTINWNFGNFNVTVEASCDIDGPAAAHVLRHCALNLLQRGPAGKAEKALAGHTWPKGKRGEPVRPPEFKRDSILFSGDNADIVQKHFTGSVDIAPDGEPACLVSFKCIDVDMRPTVDSVDSKFTEEKAILARHVAAGDTATWATTKLGFAGDLYDEASAPTVAFLKAIRTAKLALEAQIKAGL